MPRFKKNVGTDFKKFLDQLPGREKWLRVARPNFGPFLCKKDKKKLKTWCKKNTTTGRKFNTSLESM